jgi:DNA-binding PadR family transcriptional regulator
VPRPAPEDHLPLKSDVLLILIALAERPLHGYRILKDVEARTEGQVLLQTGALYRLLRRLLHDRFIEECDPPADDASDDERRRFYRPTAFGRTVLDAELTRLARLVRAARVGAGVKRARAE